MTRKLDNFRRVMIGTEGNAPRCIALQGVIGHHVWCRIYERRPSVCREFEFSWEKNASNPRCDKARAFWGLTPITPEKGFDPKGFPMAA
ncbi:MAG: YkgJ family cysteine cluster protein [Desulfobacterales bacterium]